MEQEQYQHWYLTLYCAYDVSLFIQVRMMPQSTTWTHLLPNTGMCLYLCSCFALQTLLVDVLWHINSCRWQIMCHLKLSMLCCIGLIFVVSFKQGGNNRPKITSKFFSIITVPTWGPVEMLDWLLMIYIFFCCHLSVALTPSI